ncbi:MAG: methyltransferase domain-containing protein, partial [Candidatus Baltobacteraceae bacterium]
MEGAALRSFLRAFHERYPGVTAASMEALADESGENSYRLLAEIALEDKRNARVLDAGCGDGVLLAEIRRMSAVAHLSGIDLVPSEVSLAKARVPDATIVSGDITQPLPFPDSAFDVVTAHLVMMLLGPIDATLQQIARVLRANGRFAFIVDDFVSDAEIFTHLVNVAIRATPASVSDLSARFSADARIYDSTVLKALLHKHGFDGFRERRIILRSEVDAASAWNLVSGTYPVGVLEESQLELARIAVGAEIAALGSATVRFPLKV